MNSWHEKIKKGENRKVEFKAELPQGGQLAKTAVALANGAGGDILLVRSQKLSYGYSLPRMRVARNSVSSLRTQRTLHWHRETEFRATSATHRFKSSVVLGVKDSGSIAGRSEIRNRVLAATFKQMGIIEQWGNGTAKIFAECVNNPPTYKETGGFFKVVFARPETAPKTAQKKNRPQQGTKSFRC